MYNMHDIKLHRMPAALVFHIPPLRLCGFEVCTTKCWISLHVRSMLPNQIKIGSENKVLQHSWNKDIQYFEK